jgi:nicotinamidase-related amidase
MSPDRKRLLHRGHDDLHGNVPDESRAVLLLIDVINDLSFPDNSDLVRRSVALAKSVAKLKKRCKKFGIPAIYVNDNRGRWRSDISAVLRHCLRAQSPGREMTKLLVPEPEDYIVLKPKHSPFYASPLQTILDYIGARVAIVAGVTTNACVLIAAGDLHVRDFRLFVPADCVAALTDREHRRSLEVMKNSFDADTTSSSRLNLVRLRKQP